MGIPCVFNIWSGGLLLHKHFVAKWRVTTPDTKNLWVGSWYSLFRGPYQFAIITIIRHCISLWQKFWVCHPKMRSVSCKLEKARRGVSSMCMHIYMKIL